LTSEDERSGWTKKLVQRQEGSSQGGWDAYLFAPDGTKLRSNPDLIRYCEAKQLTVDLASINLHKPPGFRRDSSRRLAAASTSGRLPQTKTKTKTSASGSSTPTLSAAPVPPEPERPQVVFSKAKTDYLESQFFRCPRPDFQQFHFLSQQIKEQSRRFRRGSGSG
jgi:hypothetical protein